MKRWWKAFGYSCDGLRAAWREEAAFRQEVILLVVAVPAAWWLAPTLRGGLLMIAAVLAVLIVELINTAIEAAIDRHGPEHHPLAKKAKDTGSAAVLLALFAAGMVWLSILI